MIDRILAVGIFLLIASIVVLLYLAIWTDIVTVDQVLATCAVNFVLTLVLGMTLEGRDD